MGSWGDTSFSNRYGKPRASGGMHWGDTSFGNRYGRPSGQSAASKPKPAAAAAPPAASSAATSAGGLPLDPVYDSQIAGLQRQRDDSLAQYSGQRPKVLADYGYTATGYDSSGAPTGLQFDVNSPYSRAALAKRTYQQQQSGTLNGMASQGQLYSGALQQRQAGDEFGYQQGSDALQKALVEALVGISQGERAAKTDYELGAGQAFGESLGRMGQTTPSLPPSPVAASSGGGKPAARKGGRIGDTSFSDRYGRRR